CTHYPVLKDVISGVLGDRIRLIDSAETTARKVYSILKTLGWLSNIDNGREDEFYVTDFPDRFKKVGEIFLQRKIDKVNTVDICTMANIPYASGGPLFEKSGAKTSIQLKDDE
ncbi:MAG TPA: hypothetical protein VK186_10315, partial [Candidatus Deferrimicrobium sp.]|nr:hypothetical protein [Candidatus Deferrimicrobium sp.]